MADALATVDPELSSRNWRPANKMNNKNTFPIIFLVLSVPSMLGQEPKPNKDMAPTLADGLQRLTGASDEESGDGNAHIEFESKSGNGCSVTITEPRALAGLDFWTKESFSLADIDPDDIHVEKLRQDQFKRAVLSGRESSR